MKGNHKEGLLISDFNIENLAAYLRNDTCEPQVQCTVAPYGQVAQMLLDGNLRGWAQGLDFALVWTRPEGVLPSFGALLNGSEIDEARLWNEIDEYSRQLLQAGGRAGLVFVPVWVEPGLHHGHGMLDLAPRIGVARVLMEANLRLLKNIEGGSNMVPLNTAKWVELAGDRAFDPRLWYMAKVPFGNDLFKTAVRDIKAALRGASGRARKLIILDLDNTLWGGIVGEVGWQKVLLGGHDPLGEAFRDFQRGLKALTKRGVLLAIASKNDEATALEAIRSHPEMVLRLDDFAGWRIDWRDKAQNIADLVASLNLGLDAVVFIDDNPVERARVRGALPEILVPDWPDDKRLYTHALHSLDCFDKPSISDEDRRRSQMYVSERKRSDRRAQIGSLDEWLGTLHQQVTVEPLSRANLGRLVQLLNKTNQMNLSTRRMSEQEFKAWADMEHHRVWAINVADTFGDSGLTGVLSVEVDGFGARIVDFLLSCRVMGRKIEEAMLHIAVEWARCAQIKEIRLVYSPTARNGPCLDFLQRSGLRSQSENVFVWDADLEYPLHPSIRLVQLSGDPSGDPASRPEIPLAAPSGANEPASDRRNQESSASGG